MEDKNKEDNIKKAPPIGPFGGGVPKPPVPPNLINKPPLPGAAFPKPQLPRIGVAYSAPQSGEADKIKEEKNKLEKKVLEMENIIAQEKEKALLATLKSQQDESLSSKVESSLKDMQDKLRRDRHEQEVEEERLTFKAKVQELENKLVQERETWMHTLKNQMRERETQSGDVETHFIYRLQEMERRWLDEKAEWQKKLMNKDEEIIKLKGNAEKLGEIKDESREVSFEKRMLEKEISKMKEEVVRLEKDRASVESYIRIIPEKEREIADFRAELPLIKMREEKALADFKHREEKLLSEIERLQKDIGGVSDRKNSEKEEELKSIREKHENVLGEKERVLAHIAGEKIRAISELLKLRGFVSKVQAINAVLEKERNQMRVEKIQMAQNMAANIEESKKYKGEISVLNATHVKEVDDLGKKYQTEIEKIKSDYAGEIVRDYDEKLAHLQKQYHEELLNIQKKSNGDINRANKEHHDEVARLHIQHQSEIENKTMEIKTQYENRTMEIKTQYENNLAEMKLSIKKQFDGEFEQEIKRLKNDKLKVGSENKEMYEEKLKAEKEYKIILEDKSRLEVLISAIKADFSNQVKKMSEKKDEIKDEYKRMDEYKATMAEEKKEYEKIIAVQEIKENNLKIKFDDLNDKFDGLSKSLAQKDLELEKNSVLAKEINSKLEKELELENDKLKKELEIENDKLKKELKTENDELRKELNTENDELRKESSAANDELKKDLKTESDNRASFESEVLFLKQKIQKMELEAQESENQMLIEKDGFAETQTGYEDHITGQDQQIQALANELNTYKEMEGKLADRVKWAFKKRE
ncbi:MAG: hypothetical protein KAQ76_00700 [Elusimicrobiales bacterium]|nr:hypothetical protein [Elusimicrobiales bacterium]